jgi:hypothetical protein
MFAENGGSVIIIILSSEQRQKDLKPSVDCSLRRHGAELFVFVSLSLPS